MNSILFAVLIVSAMGLLIGIILAVASVVMAVPKNETVQAVLEALPGVNCGACGYSGCEDYAKALAENNAEPGLCSPGGAQCTKAVAQILGKEAAAFQQKVAFVYCKGTCEQTEPKMHYQGEASCAGSVQLHGGAGKCGYGCLGLGDCAAACKFNAIDLAQGIAHVDFSQCTGCTSCVAACPNNLIGMIPVKAQAAVKCSNKDKGGQTRKDCAVGCIGCMKCVKACQYNAITMASFKAEIDPELCTACGKCVDVCPQNTISFYQA